MRGANPCMRDSVFTRVVRNLQRLKIPLFLGYWFRIQRCRTPSGRTGAPVPNRAVGRPVQRSLADLKLSTVSKRFEIQYFQGVSGFWIFLGYYDPKKIVTEDGRQKRKFVLAFFGIPIYTF